MNASFRCERCGGTLRAQGEAGDAVRCPHCGKALRVPEALASLPRPILNSPGAEAAPRAAPQAGTAVAAVERVMPYVISLFFHLSLVTVTVFVGTMLVERKAAPTQIPTPDFAITPMGDEKEMGLPDKPPLGDPAGNPNLQTKVTPDSVRRSLVTSPGGDGRDAAIGPADHVFGLPMHLATSPNGRPDGNGLGRDKGPPTISFFDKPFGWPDGDPLRRGPRRSHVGRHVVYVVDRSGSMLPTFDEVRAEMLRSIGLLDPNRQDFHVILFSDGPPLEAEARRLVPATPEFKARAAVWLKDQYAKGTTDPVPALSRALDVLDRVDSSGGKVICLLTDSQFPDSEAVLKLLRQRNAKKDVVVFTFLYGDGMKDAVETMEKVARENGGVSQVVRPE